MMVTDLFCRGIPGFRGENGGTGCRIAAEPPFLSPPWRRGAREDSEQTAPPALTSSNETHGVQENQQDGHGNRNLQQKYPTLVEQAQPASREEFLLA